MSRYGSNFFWNPAAVGWNVWRLVLGDGIAARPCALDQVLRALRGATSGSLLCVNRANCAHQTHCRMWFKALPSFNIRYFKPRPDTRPRPSTRIESLVFIQVTHTNTRSTHVASPSVTEENEVLWLATHTRCTGNLYKNKIDGGHSWTRVSKIYFTERKNIMEKNKLSSSVAPDRINKNICFVIKKYKMYYCSNWALK